jgi:hypothetical protein
LEFLFETPEAFSVFGHSADIFLQDDVLRWGGAYHFSEPPEMGRGSSWPGPCTVCRAGAQRL